MVYLKTKYIEPNLNREKEQQTHIFLTSFSHIQIKTRGAKELIQKLRRQLNFFRKVSKQELGLVRLISYFSSYLPEVNSQKPHSSRDMRTVRYNSYNEYSETSGGVSGGLCPGGGVDDQWWSSLY